MIPWLREFRAACMAKSVSCSGRSPTMRTGSKEGLGREYPEPKGWIVAREHPRPPLDCQLFPDGWLIAELLREHGFDDFAEAISRAPHSIRRQESFVWNDAISTTGC
jgi:hypothetical protein